MISFVTLLSVAITAANVMSMPTSNPDLQEIAAIANQAIPAAENDESDLLRVFSDQMMEAIHAINTILNLTTQWIDVMGQSKEAYCAEKTSTIVIPAVYHDSLSHIQNVRLRALLQMSNYANYLKSLGNSATDYAHVTTLLFDLRRKINNIVFTLGELLTNVPRENITLFTEEDVSGHVITAPQTTAADKRSICYCVLKLMLSDSQTTLKSVGTNAIAN